MFTETTKELVRVIELDFDRTSRFIDSLVGMSATIRGLLVSAWIALITLAFETSHWTLAAASFGVVVVFGLLDVYHSWLYDQALEHATELEGISGCYYNALARGSDDPDAQKDLEVKLRVDRFGTYRNLRKFRFGWKELATTLSTAQSKIFFQVLYPTLLAASIAATIILAVNSTTQKCYSVEVTATPASGASSHNLEIVLSSATISPKQQFLVCAGEDH